MRVKKRLVSQDGRPVWNIENAGSFRKWGDLSYDILVTIFKKLNITNLSSASRVCKLWRSAASDRSIWKVLDLGLLKSLDTNSPYQCYLDYNAHVVNRLTNILLRATAISMGNIRCIIFSFHIQMTDHHLEIIANRCHNVRRLVLPDWNYFTNEGFCNAMKKLDELKSMTMPYMKVPSQMIEGLGNSCSKLTELKLRGCFDVKFSHILAANLQRVKVLSLRCSIITKEALVDILDNMKNLEALNISHCLLLDNPEADYNGNLIKELDDEIYEKAERLQVFMFSTFEFYKSFKEIERGPGFNPYWYFAYRYRLNDEFWRHDEVSSLDAEHHPKLYDIISAHIDDY